MSVFKTLKSDSTETKTRSLVRVSVVVDIVHTYQTLQKYFLSASQISSDMSSKIAKKAVFPVYTALFGAVSTTNSTNLRTNNRIPL